MKRDAKLEARLAEWERFLWLQGFDVSEGGVCEVFHPEVPVMLLQEYLARMKSNDTTGLLGQLCRAYEARASL